MSILLLLGLETGINGYLQFRPNILERLSVHEGKVIAFDLTDLNKQIYALFCSKGVQLMSNYAGKPDVVIHGSSPALFHASIASLKRQPVNGLLEIEGDIELGQEISAIFSEIGLLGDEFIGKLTNTEKGKCAVQYIKRSANYLREDVTEFLQEEARHLIPREELADFCQAVDELRDDVERLTLRMQRL